VWSPRKAPLSPKGMRCPACHAEPQGAIDSKQRGCWRNPSGREKLKLPPRIGDAACSTSFRRGSLSRGLSKWRRNTGILQCGEESRISARAGSHRITDLMETLASPTHQTCRPHTTIGQTICFRLGSIGPITRRRDAQAREWPWAARGSRIVQGAAGNYQAKVNTAWWRRRESNPRPRKSATESLRA